MASTAVTERPAARPAATPARPARTSGPPGPTAAPTPGATTAGPRPTDGAAPRVRLAAVPSAEEVSLKGSGTFAPPQSVVGYLTGQQRGGDVAVRFPGIAAGLIHVQKHGDKYRTPDTPQAIAIDHPALNPLRDLQLPPMLVVRVHDNVVTGYVTVAAGTKLVPSPQALVAQIKQHSAALGLVGMGELQIPPVENKLEGGALSLKTDLSFKLGGFLSGKGSFGLTDDVVTFAAHADASVKGVANLAVDLERHPDGVIAGRAEIPVQLKNFSGNFLLVFAGGLVDVTGKFKYTTEKLSGEVTLLITDAQTARTVAYQHLPPEAIDASARQAAGGSAVAAAPSSAGPKPGPRAVAGWGTLDVHYSEWLTGKALVVVDNEGHVTVTGKITPPAKVEFKQTQLDFEKQIFKFEVRATYGLPYVGDVFLFAGVALFAIAKISPLTISKIEIVGTYSTDPAIFNSFSLSANINISALAGLKLRAEGGLGIEILSHDIKIGAAVLATAGIRAYVDATPVIGYRELADPTAGRRGEFYIHGEAEIAAQPFLALGGELFVKLETPWWSPVSDHTWTWPLGELIYPLPGEIGVGVDVDYIFGSGKLPTISPKAVDFNSDRFMSDLMDDKVGHGGAEELKKPGKWNERLQAPPPPPAPPKLKDSKGAAKKRDDKPTKDKAKTWAGGMAALGELKKRSDTQPYGAAEIDAALKALKTQYGFSVLQAKVVGDQWEISATKGKDTLKKPLRIKRATGAALTPGRAVPAPTGPPGSRPATPTPGAAGADARTPDGKLAAVNAAARDAQSLLSAVGATPASVRAGLPGLVTKYKLTSAALEEVGADDYDVILELNPRAKTPKKHLVSRPRELIGLATPRLDELAVHEPGVPHRYVSEYKNVYKGKMPLLRYVEGRAARKLGRLSEGPGIALYNKASGSSISGTKTTFEILAANRANAGVVRVRVPDFFSATTAVGDFKNVDRISYDEQMRDDYLISRGRSCRIPPAKVILGGTRRFDLCVRAPKDADGGAGTKVYQPLLDAIAETGGEVYEIL